MIIVFILIIVMQVLVGPTYNMDVSASSSSPVCVIDRNSTISCGIPASAAEDDGSSSNNNNNNNNINEAVSSSSCLFLKGGNVNGVVVGDQSTYGSDDSSDSSSIGSPGDSEDEDEEEDVVSSSEKDVGLQKSKFSMSSLEDSLTSKRGLSNHYSGKSKSFGNLTEVVSKSSAMAIKELEKEENPFNKRRRLVIANKWSRKFFYSSRHNPNKSMPLLPILPDDDVEEEEEEEEEENSEANNHEDKGNKLKVKTRGFKSQSCFCLADLAEEQEDEDEDP